MDFRVFCRHLVTDAFSPLCICDRIFCHPVVYEEKFPRMHRRSLNEKWAPRLLLRERAREITACHKEARMGWRVVHLPVIEKQKLQILSNIFFFFCCPEVWPIVCGGFPLGFLFIKWTGLAALIYCWILSLWLYHHKIMLHNLGVIENKRKSARWVLSFKC